LANLNLPFQHSRKSVQERYNRARENIEKEELKNEIKRLKNEIATLKDVKGKAEEKLVLEQHLHAAYLGRRGLETFVEDEIAREKHYSIDIVAVLCCSNGIHMQ
jgi:hypothetical protein